METGNKAADSVPSGFQCHCHARGCGYDCISWTMSFGRISCDRCLLFLVNQGALTHINVRGGCSTTVFLGSLNKIPWDDVCAHLTVLLDSESFISRNSLYLKMHRSWDSLGWGSPHFARTLVLEREREGPSTKMLNVPKGTTWYVKKASQYIFTDKEKIQKSQGGISRWEGHALRKMFS